MLTPATVEDARWMLAAALGDPDPVFIFEHALLYPMDGELDQNVTGVDINKASIKREGSDVTLIASSGSVFKTLRLLQAYPRKTLKLK